MDTNIKKDIYNIKNKKITQLDSLLLKFINILNKYNIKYVVISGYVAILFGRSRGSEDIDLFIEKINYITFEKLWRDLYNFFECTIENNMKEAYYEYINSQLPLRFAKKKTFIPNIEIKVPTEQIEWWVLENRQKVILNNKHKIYISPIEPQIAYKLFLSSEKDIEDAKFIYNLFLDKIDPKLLKYFINKLKVEQMFRKYLLWTSYQK
jgi:hypothetical protein